MALFRSPDSPFRKVLRRRMEYAGPCVPMPGSALPKNSLLSISTCQRPCEEEIGRPNAANYYLTFSGEKHRFLGRIIPSFWAIIPLWHQVGGNPGLIRARIRGAGPWVSGWPGLSRRAGCWGDGRPGGGCEDGTATFDNKWIIISYSSSMIQSGKICKRILKVSFY